MANYKFLLACWQDKVGSDNATATISVNGSAVLTNVEVASTSVDSPTMLTWESTGLAEPHQNGSVTAAIKIELSNDLYVDETTDRNIWIGALEYNCKGINASNAAVYMYMKTDGGSGFTFETMDDDTDIAQYSSVGNTQLQNNLPSAVTGDQIPSDMWTTSLADNNSFYHIPVWGGDDGVTITMPLKVKVDEGRTDGPFQWTVPS